METGKQLLAAVLDSQPLLRVLALLRGTDCAVFFLHRFAHPDRGMHGTPPQALRAQLAWLRRHRFPIVSLGALIERLLAGEPPVPRSVVFTVDDGYADFAEVGFPVFEEFDCPVSLFVTTGFVDGANWMWWDQVRFAIANARRRRSTFEVGNERLQLDLGETSERRATGQALADRLERLPDVELRRAVENLYAALDLERPPAPPAEYAPMRWDDARACRARGVEIGPHTVTHPILSHVDAEASRREIEASWRRVCAEVPGALPVFAYPNGSDWAYGDREERVVAQAGLRAALATRSAYVAQRDARGSSRGTIGALPRFYADAHLLRMMLVTSGIEGVRTRLRKHR
jgi:peptidoglycan/xylan/chitin deacetylase (PgdA/CDA1 family)